MKNGTSNYKELVAMKLASILSQFIKNGFESGSTGIPIEQIGLSEEERNKNKEMMRISVEIVSLLYNADSDVINWLFLSELMDSLLLLLDGNQMYVMTTNPIIIRIVIQ